MIKLIELSKLQVMAVIDALRQIQECPYDFEGWELEELIKELEAELEGQDYDIS